MPRLPNSGRPAVHHPHGGPTGSGPGRRVTLRAVRGRLRSLNDRLEQSVWGDAAATILFAIGAYALFFIGGVLQ
jgi:hypothetical protein